MTKLIDSALASMRKTYILQSGRIMHLSPKEKRWLLRGMWATLILVLIAAVDLTKSDIVCQVVAHKFGATRTSVRDVAFDGYWRITLYTNIPGIGVPVRYTVTPILPVVYPP